jgi:hypothetical protein
MSKKQSFGVLLTSRSAYRIDGAFRYAAAVLPQEGEVITIVDEIAGTEREARVHRVRPESPLEIHATDVTPSPPDRQVAPRERARRGSPEEAQRVFNARRGWLSRQRRLER